MAEFKVGDRVWVAAVVTEDDLDEDGMIQMNTDYMATYAHVGTIRPRTEHVPSVDGEERPDG